MKKFSTHIWIDGTGEPGPHGCENYEKTVTEILQRIRRSHSGGDLLAEIDRRAQKKMVIIPLNGVFNAFASANDYAHATPKDIAERSGVDGHLLTDATGHNINGQGGGSDTVIKFTASTWVNYCSTGHNGHKSGAQPDEILFHEMVHAAREMRGLFSPRPLGHAYDTVEEFFAILVANIYASETGRKMDLRWDHHTFDPLPNNQDTSKKFLPAKDLSDYKYELVAQFVRQESGLSQALRHVNTSFNPIRRYYQLQNPPARKHSSFSMSH